MTDPALRLVEHYHSRGVLVDTNILLLHFVGSLDPKFISQFKRTDQFTADDYHRLKRLLKCFSSIVTTPNILSEVNSLCGQIGEPRRTECFRKFARGIGTLDEKYVESATASRMEQFPRLGLTDSGILYLASKRYLVLTDDFALYRSLEEARIDVLNFNHLRQML